MPKNLPAALFIFVLLASACSAPTQPATTTPSPQLTPYVAPVSTAKTVTSASPSPAPRTRVPTVPPPPTPTPVTYTIKKGDTLLAVAFRYGIKLEDLQSANPQVDPRILPVGTVLVIPLSIKEGTPVALPTPTALPMQIGQSRCYAQAGGSLSCIAPVRNDLQQDVENISAWASLIGPDGETITGTLANLPLDRLPAGESLPLFVFFPSAPATGAQVQMDLLTAMAAPEGSSRYLPAVATVSEQTIAPGGLEAQVQGTVSLPAGVVISPTAPLTATTSASPTPTPAATSSAAGQTDYAQSGRARLAVLAYDTQANIVGLRIWEVPGALLPGGSLPFDVTVYSLGPAIARLEVRVEARP